MLKTILRNAGSIASFAIGDLTQRPSLGEDVSASEFTDFFQKVQRSWSGRHGHLHIDQPAVFHHFPDETQHICRQ